MSLRHQRGMTLLETLAALTVFALVTVGITPLLATSIRGSDLTRSYTVGKDAGQQAMERARGLPYYVSYQAQTKKVDVLDMYFPCAQDPTNPVNTGCAGEGTRQYNGTDGIFTVTCPAVVRGPTCAVPLPEGYSIEFRARFVTPDTSAPVIPPTTYKRDPASTDGQLDLPPSQLLELTVTTSWSIQGETKSYELQTLIGDRKFGEVKMTGLGRINYAVQAQTSFVHEDERRSTLKAIVGSAESRIETRLVSTADQRVRAADISLVEIATDEDPLVDPVADPLLGVVGEFRAPPSQTPTVSASPAAQVVMTHPQVFGTPQIAALNPTTASNLSAAVASELPSAGGRFGFNSGSGNLGYLWVQNQADTTQGALLQLDPTRKVLSLRDAGSATLTGETAAATGALGAPDRRVQTAATVDLELLRLMPTTFLTVKAETQRFVAILQDFHAEVDCKSVGSSLSEATGNWSADFKFWYDTNPTNNVSSSLELTQETIELDQDVAAATPDLRTILAAEPHNFPDGNPLVFDGLTSGTDVYLFDDPANNKKGYLTSVTMTPLVTSEDAEGTLTTADVDGAIHITSVPTDPEIPESGLNLNVGSLRCEALDNR